MIHCSPSLGASQQSASMYFSIDHCSLVVQGVPPHQRHCQTPCSAQTAMTNYDLSSFDCNFPRNDNQTFNVYTESTLSIYIQKGPVYFFPVLEFAPKENFLCQPKCSYYFGPEGVIFSVALVIFPKGRRSNRQKYWSTILLV